MADKCYNAVQFILSIKMIKLCLSDLLCIVVRFKYPDSAFICANDIFSYFKVAEMFISSIVGAQLNVNCLFCIL